MGLGATPHFVPDSRAMPVVWYQNKFAKKDLTLSCSLDEAWWMPDLKAPHAHTCEPTLPELHRRLRQVVNYTESSLRVNRMCTKTNGFVLRNIMLIWSGIHADVIRLTVELPNLC